MPSKAYQDARREQRIMSYCETSASFIISELEVSGGDHSEDVETLAGLIEGWRALRYAHEETMELEKGNGG
jgi:hypothetical protein